MNLQPAERPTIPTGAWTKILDAKSSRRNVAIINESATVGCRVALQFAEPVAATEGIGLGSGYPISSISVAYDGSVWAYQASGDDFTDLVTQEGF